SSTRLFLTILSFFSTHAPPIEIYTLSLHDALPIYYKYVARLTEFAQEWERKSDTRSLPEFLEYLDYFEQAGGIVALEDDAPADAVKLMTVHGAKGLEFPRVFVLRVNNKKFPAMERPRVFE